MKKKVAQSKIIKKAKPAMTDEAAGRIALEILYQKMAKGNEGLKHLTPKGAAEAAKQLGITYTEMVDFAEKFYGEFTRRMIANLKKT